MCPSGTGLNPGGGRNRQRKLLHNSAILVIVKHLCSYFRCQILQEENTFPSHAVDYNSLSKSQLAQRKLTVGSFFIQFWSPYPLIPGIMTDLKSTEWVTSGARTSQPRHV